MEQTKKSTFKLLFYLKKNELKKNGNAPIMARITIDGTAKTFGTKLEINPNNWDLKYGRVEGKSATALSINQKLDNIRGRIDKIYEDMLKHEGFANTHMRSSQSMQDHAIFSIWDNIRKLAVKTTVKRIHYV